VREAEDDEGYISGARRAVTAEFPQFFILAHVWLSIGAVVKLSKIDPRRAAIY
jgi:hypothetical protein